MLHAVVMAGGSGTRFWPRSRRNRPKQLLNLYGDATMLQQTVARVAPLVPPDRVLIITGADQAEAVRAQLPEVPAENVVAEPCPRDTAPCVGLAATIIGAKDPAGTMIIMPADHVIEPRERFLANLSAAVELIDDDPETLVTFGIVPSHPETGYGYIERGMAQNPRHGIHVYAVAQFREKPDRATAEQFVASGRFYWNSGIFVWRARAILDELTRHQPRMAASLRRIGDALGQPDVSETLAREFPGMDRIPIDKAVLEKTRHLSVLEVVYNWNDVGDWRALTSLVDSDDQGNTVQGDVHLVETSNTIVVSDGGGLIATLGVDDLVIVQSGGATLVARKDQLDKLKGLVEGLDRAGFGSIL